MLRAFYLCYIYISALKVMKKPKIIGNIKEIKKPKIIGNIEEPNAKYLK